MPRHNRVLALQKIIYRHIMTIAWQSLDAPRPWSRRLTLVSSSATTTAGRQRAWARPIAVTGQIGYQIPTRPHLVEEDINVPQVLVYGGSVSSTAWAT